MTFPPVSESRWRSHDESNESRSGCDVPESRAVVLGAVTWACAPTSAQPLPQPPPGGSLGLALGVASVPNLRDIGGYQTRDGGVVARGLVYRSDAFIGMSAEDIKKIEPLGLKNDYDLRVAAEAKAAPDELPANVRHHLLNVMADVKPAALPDINGLLRKPKEANVVLGDGKVEALFIAGYREFITLPSANRAYRTLFISLADSKNLPAVFHCASGKDRTGWAAAALLTLLGVPKETVIADYMRTNAVPPAAVGQRDRRLRRRRGRPRDPRGRHRGQA